MPVIICPHCDERQSVSRDLAGLTATCTGCGEGIRIPLAAPKPPKSASSPKVVAADEPEMSGTDLRKTVLLLGGLIVGVLAVLAVLLYAVTPSKKEAPAAAVAPVATPAFPEREFPAGKNAVTGRDDSHAGFTVASILAMGYVGLVVVTLLFIAYVVGIFAVGIFLARDASARGLPPLPWAAAYFLSHAVGPTLGGVVATPLLVTFPPLGVMAGLILSLVGGWYGGLMYLAVRRPGTKSPCPRCRNVRLKYLVTCPHCGAVEAA